MRDFGFGHEDILSANRNNGIGGFMFDSTQFGGGQISGNTSVDNFVARVVPEPSTFAALGGLGLLVLLRRKKK